MNNNNNDLPKISVLTATFQGEKYILYALESIIDNIKDLKSNNIELNIQIVIVDDGSTDQTEIIVKEFLDKHKYLDCVYLKQVNQGQAQAFQNALTHIQGELVLLLDGDDKFLPSKIRKVYNTFTDPKYNEYVMVTHPQFIIKEKGERNGKVSPKAAKLSSGDVTSQARKTGSIVAPASSGLCFRSKTFADIHPSPACGLKPCSGADSYLSLAASLKGPILALEEPLSEYRRHSEGKFLKRLSSLSGLKTQLNLQNKMETHLGLTNCLNHNSYFARIDYVYSKMTKPFYLVLPSLTNLLKTTITDKNFNTRNKILLIGFWTTCFFLPKKLFWKIWLKFLKIR
jgi:glycosyltransferase involved in cell wall biosynthesis